MIYLFYGSDEAKVRAKAFAFVAVARAKEPNVAYARLATGDIVARALEEAAAAGSLFAKRTLVLLDDPYQAARTKNVEEEGEEPVVVGTSPLDAHLELLAASENVIVILAPKLSVTKAKSLAAHATKEYRFDTPPGRPTARGFNNGLVNALAARSRERLWLEVARALRAGDAPEQLHGLLHWKARDLMEKGAPCWTQEESRTLSLALIALLMDSRRKGLDLASALERFALSI